MALASGRPSPRYRNLKPILETNQDRIASARPDDDGGPGDDEAGYVRGADFYGRCRTMELSVETKRKLRDMGASDLLDALEAQDDGVCMGMTCAERVQMAVDEAHGRPGGERKITRKYAAFLVLVLDEWLLDRPDELFRSFLLELMEARYGTASTVFCIQFRQKDWHARLGGGVHADAIMDRIVHGAAWVGMGEMNMRRRLGGSPS